MTKVVVCTDKRGVFFGECVDKDADPMTLTNARMCVYWSRDVRGVVGLAATGPTSECRITKPAPSARLRGITCVLDVSDEAAAAWEAAPWSS
ncbi:MAG: hypothetical protein OES09_05515 [Gammaproteobacteria bacterium]|nr:hypothetical protein [Gammaproteobacteria bacterium]